MRLSPALSRIILFVALIAAVLSGGVGLMSVRQDLEALRLQTHEQITWQTAQLELEFQRFQQSLLSFRIAQTGTSNTAFDTASDVNTRFDVLWSRVVVFQRGKLGERLQRFDSETGAVDALFATMQENEGSIVSISGLSGSELDGLYAAFLPHGSELQTLSRRVVQGEAEQDAALREEFRNSIQLTLVLSLVGVVLSVAVATYASMQTRRYRQLADHNRDLAVKAEAAAEAKSRFLTMMSHELRTPMNGVLGVISLLKQGGMSVPQIRLLDQAERSANEMISMLTDVLDFSALENHEIEISSQPFDTRSLEHSISDLFASTARREGVKFDVSRTLDCPERIKGDYQRIRQIAVNLCGYVVQTAGTEDIELVLGFAEPNIEMELFFTYPDSGGAWNPSLITGETQGTETSFATAALGPAIARGLIAAMGGSLELDVADGNRIKVTVRIPAETVGDRRILVRVEATSPAMEAICKAALSDERIVFVDGASSEMVGAVVVDVAYPGIVDHIALLRREHPSAILIGVGKTSAELGLDQMIDYPFDLRRLRPQLFSGQAG